MPSPPKQKQNETDAEYLVRYRIFRDKANAISRKSRMLAKGQSVDIPEVPKPEPKPEPKPLPAPVPEPVVTETPEEKARRQYEQNKAKQREIYYKNQEERKEYGRNYYYENRERILEKAKVKSEPKDKLDVITKHYESQRRAWNAYNERKREEKKANGTYRPKGRPRKYPVLPISPEVKPEPEPTQNTIDLLPFTI